MNYCRICLIDGGNLTYFLSSILLGKQTVKDFLEKICSVRYSSSDELSRKVCAVCFVELQLYALKQEKWKNGEITLKDKLKIKKRVNELDSSLQPVIKVRKLSSVDATLLFFDKILKGKNLMTDFDAFSHIQIDHCFCNAEGEISQEWIAAYGSAIKYWSDVKLECIECNESNIFAFPEFLNHLANHKEVTIFCPESGCIADHFTSVADFINHYITFHENDHLAFMCLCKQMCYNVPALLRHYSKNHANATFHICIECNFYCENLEDLKTHYKTHTTFQNSATLEAISTETKENHSENSKKMPSTSSKHDSNTTKSSTRDTSKISHSSKSSKDIPKPTTATSSKTHNNNAANNLTGNVRALNIKKSKSEVALEKKPRGRPPNSSNKTNSGALRSTQSATERGQSSGSKSPRIQCQYENCNRYMTKQGYAYHINVHLNIFPYPCRICDRKFRTAYARTAHEKEHIDK